MLLVFVLLLEDVFSNAELEFTQCVMLISDGAEVMMGRHNGVQALMKVLAECDNVFLILFQRKRVVQRRGLCGALPKYKQT